MSTSSLSFAPPVAAGLSLAERFREVRERTELLCAPLLPEDTVVQPMLDVSPPKWHLAHVTWFWETFLLKEHLPGYSVFHPDYAFLFNSYYNSLGSRVNRADRGTISRPALADVYAYRAHIDQHMPQLLALADTLPPTFHEVFELGLQHEQQHQELLATDIKYILSTSPLAPDYFANSELEKNREPELIGSESVIQNAGSRIVMEPELNSSELLIQNSKFRIQNYPQSKAAWLPVPGGISRIGYEGTGFCFDNELNAHEVLTADFEIQNRLVTNGEYLEFVAAGGYQDFRHWLGEGWDLVQSEGWEAPLYWVQKNEQWHRFTHRGLQPVNLAAPVTHVSFYEAQAYATWVGARLLTEQEWEVAARYFQATPEGGTFLESNLLDPQPLSPTADPARCHQLLGDAWEWTYSAYHPYPGYNRAPGALGEYNGKFMVNQLVLRGGSCATPVSHIRLTYRNFFHADKRWQFTGIRLAR